MNEGLGIGGHHSAKARSVEWLTPPGLLETLAPFDLDPCAPEKRPWPMAKNHYTMVNDGLLQTWYGLVWLNPPYGNETGVWLERLAGYGNGIALTFARTETAAWHQWVWPHAKAIVFLRGRLHFHYPDGTRAKSNASGPSALIGYGETAARRLENRHVDGHFVRLRP